MSSFTSARHRIYLFSMTNGKKKLAYGPSPEGALEILAFRLSESEMAEILKQEWRVVSQAELRALVPQLG